MAKKVKKYKKYSTKNPVSKMFFNNYLKTVITILRPLSISSILDAGCGEGLILARLQKEKIGKSWEGADSSQQAIEICKKNYATISFNQADITKLPYKNNAFDLVMATEVLEHLEHPRKALKELLRVSNKYVLLTVPNEPFFKILHMGKSEKNLQSWSSSKFVEFVRREEVKIMLKKLPFPWTMLLIKKK